MERRHHGRGGDEEEVLDWEREGRPKEGRGWRPKRGGKLGFPYGRLPTWASWAKACGPGWRIFTENPFSLVYSLFSLLNLLMNIAQIPSPNNILPNLCLGYYILPPLNRIRPRIFTPLYSKEQPQMRTNNGIHVTDVNKTHLKMKVSHRSYALQARY